jgi:hypothetical protein
MPFVLSRVPIAFVVQPIFAVRYVGPLPCSFLCRALSSIVAMNRIFAVHSYLCLPWPKSLSCVFHAHGEETFVVRGTPQSYTARQRVFFPVVIAPTEFFL